MDFLASEKNRENTTKGLPSVFLQGSAPNVSFDDWVSVLNRRLRPATTSMAVTKDGAEVKDTIKAVAKALED